MDNSFSNSFQALEDNDREYDELLGTSMDGSSSSDDVSDSSENLCLNDEKGLDQDIQNVNPPANKVGSSSSGSMAISSSEKGSSENVKASDNTSNEDSSRSLANLCLKEEKGMDQDIQNVNPPAAKLGTSSSESMAISSSDEGSSEKVKASDNISNEDSSRSSANLCLNEEKGTDQDIQNVNPPAAKLGTSSSESMAISSSDEGSSEKVKASDNISNEDSSRSSANLCLNEEKGTDQDIQNVNPPAAKLGTSSSESMAISSSDEGSSEKVKASDNASNVKNHTSDVKEDDNNDRSSAPNFNNGGEFPQLDLSFNVEGNSFVSARFSNEGSRSFIWPSMGEEGFQNLMHIVDRLESVSRIRSVNTIFEEALDCCCIFDMMTSAYGHQVFGKLVGLLDEHNNGKLLEQITKNQLLISVSLYEYGSISVQKLIEVLHNHNKTQSIRTLTEALAEGTHTLLTHERGKQVVLKCFGILDFDDYKTLYEALGQQCVKIARHEVGWISLCQCMDHMKNPQRRLFIDGVVIKNRLPISWTSYGIQVLEYIIRLQDPYLSEKFCSLFKEFERLSFTREGACLVEICLQQSKAMMRLVVQNILKGEGLAKLACDKYGNHVIQTALKTTMGTDIETHQCLFEALEPHMPTLRFHPTGKAVYQLIDQKRR